MRTLEQLDAAVAKLESAPQSPGFWAGLTAWLAEHPAIAHTLNALFVSAATWTITYFSVPATREVLVPGPQKAPSTQQIIEDFKRAFPDGVPGPAPKSAAKPSKE